MTIGKRRFAVSSICKEKRDKVENYTLQVPSIGCQGCMNKIVKKLQTLSGVEITETDLAEKKLFLRYAPQEIAPEQIENAIREVGHRLTPNSVV